MRLTPFILSLAATLLLQGCVSEHGSTVDQSAVIGNEQPAGIEPISGIDKKALATVIGIGSQIGVFYYPDKIDRKQLDAAPARLCAERGAKVYEIEDADLHHPEELPGARHLVVRCTG
ncbi:hypothetical protein [Ruegeria atlantica]|uniref:hypothetical protein n=1 Tax=Ruegeria atlantica TaxID=81569 RepID=UPI00147F82D9|nr:hypothetical protein [Ruegeria atlantica]